MIYRINGSQSEVQLTTKTDASWSKGFVGMAREKR